MVVLYHYTNEEGAAAIESSKTIRKSVGAGGRDVRYGEGTYFTSLSPREHLSRVFHNNFGVPRNKVNEQHRLRVEYIIQVTFPSNDPRLKKCQTKRDIWLYKDSDVDLNKFQYLISKCSEFDGEKIVKELGGYGQLVCSLDG
jgi:hypothetical protein